MAANSLIPRVYEGEVVEQRLGDGYVNATAMCKAAGKRLEHYLENESTNAFLAELCSETGIPTLEIIQVIKGGIPERRGTWVHPQVAIHLGQWLSPRFAVQVSKWVFDWMSGGGPKASNLPYYLRRVVANQKNIPEGHFSVLNELAIVLIGPLVSLGYILPEKLWPDISEGLMFAKWLRTEKGINTDDMPTYVHQFEDGRPAVRAKAYPNELWPVFQKHLSGIWLKSRAREYFLERDPKALEYLPKALDRPAPMKSITTRRAQ